MTEQVTELRREVQSLFTQVNNVIQQNIMLIRELNELSADKETVDYDLIQATEQFNTLMSKLNIMPNDDTAEKEEKAEVQAVALA